MKGVTRTGGGEKTSHFFLPNSGNGSPLLRPGTLQSRAPSSFADSPSLPPARSVSRPRSRSWPPPRLRRPGEGAARPGREASPPCPTSPTQRPVRQPSPTSSASPGPLPESGSDGGSQGAGGLPGSPAACLQDGSVQEG